MNVGRNGCSWRFTSNENASDRSKTTSCHCDVQLVKRTVAFGVEQAIVQQWSPVKVPRFDRKRFHVYGRIGQPPEEQARANFPTAFEFLAARDTQVPVVPAEGTNFSPSTVLPRTNVYASVAKPLKSRYALRLRAPGAIEGTVYC